MENDCEPAISPSLSITSSEMSVQLADRLADVTHWVKLVALVRLASMRMTSFMLPAATNDLEGRGDEKIETSGWRKRKLTQRKGETLQPKGM